MGELSFIEKLKIFVDTSLSSGICIASIFIFLFLAFMILTTNKKNAKSTKLLFIGIYAVLILIMLSQYSDSLKDMFDYMMNNFFIVFYFPNVAIYLAAIIATNIILWVTIFNFKEDKLLKIINTIIYCIIHYLLILILNIVSDKNIDVFSQTSIYGNEKASALISLTSIIFIIWIIFITIYKIIRSTQKKKKIVIKKKPLKKLNPNIIQIAVPSYVKGESLKKYPKEVYQTNLMDLYSQNNLVKEEIKKYSNMLTLDDYRLVLSILKNKSALINQNVNKSKIISQQKENIKQKNSYISKDYNSISMIPTKLDELLNI